MKKPASRKTQKKAAASEPEQKTAPLGREHSAPMTILELAASFWDAARDYPTERRA